MVTPDEQTQSNGLKGMTNKARLTAIYIAVCSLLAAAVCGVTALIMIRVIGWYISHCGESPTCTSVSLVISYWWVLFVPACLLAAYLLRKDYDRRVQCLTGPAKPDA